LNCARYRQLMSRYVDGEVTLRQRQELLGHVESCRDCAAWLARLRQADVLLKGIPDARPSDRVRSAVLRSVSKATPAQHNGRKPLTRSQSIRLSAMGLLLRFDPSPRRLALLFALFAAVVASLGYYLNVLPPLWSYTKLGFEVSKDASVAEVNTQPLAAMSSGYNGVAGPVAVPNAVRLLPGDKSLGVDLDEPVRVRFDLPMDRASVERALLIEPPAAGTFEWSADNEMSYSPYEPGLLRGITYTVTLSNSARSLQGIPLKAPISWEFRTREPYSVLSNIPTGSAIAPTSMFTLTFETPMDKADFARNLSLRLKAATQDEVVPIALLWDVEGRQVAVSPSTPLDEGEARLHVPWKSKTQSGDTLGRPFDAVYNVALPTPRLRLLDGRLAVVSSSLPALIRYEAVTTDAAYSTPSMKPEFAAYRLSADRLSALAAQSSKWPSRLPDGSPFGDPLGGLDLVLSTQNGAAPATAQLIGLQAGIYLVVSTAASQAGALSDWQMLIVADRALTLAGPAGPFWATDEGGRVWANAEISLYSPQGGLLEKGLADEHGLWQPSNKIASASLAIAQDASGHVAALNLEPVLAARTGRTTTIQNTPGPPKSTGDLGVSLQTDLPEYLPGHVVRFRALLHGAARGVEQTASQLSLPEQDMLEEQEVSVLLLDPRGVALAALTLKPDSVGGVIGLFNLSPDAEPGAYTLRVRSGAPVAARDFTLRVKSGPSPANTLSVLIAPTPDIDEQTGFMTGTVSVLGQVGEPGAGALLTATLGIDGDAWTSEPVTSTVGTDGRAIVVSRIPEWLLEKNDPGLHLRVEARRASLWGSDSYYLDLTPIKSAEQGIAQMTSPQLGVAVVSRPLTDGVRIEVTQLPTAAEESECCGHTIPTIGDLLLIAQAPTGERFARSLAIGTKGASITLPRHFDGGTLRFYRAGVAEPREMRLLPPQGGDVSLRMSAPQTVVANSPLSVGLDLLDANGEPVSGVASVWLRRIAVASDVDSLRSWQPNVELQASTTITTTLYAPDQPGLWYVMAEATTSNGDFTRSRLVVRVRPGPVLQMPPAQSAIAGQPQSASVVVYNQTDAPLSISLVATGEGSVRPLAGPFAIEVGARNWYRAAWRFVAEREGSSILLFSPLPGYRAYPLNVSASANPRTDVTYSSGVTTERAVGVQVPSGLASDAVQLEVRASTSLLPALASIARDLLMEPVGARHGVAMSAARLSAPYAVASAYQRSNSQPPANSELTNVGRSLLLQQLYSSQRHDGGWGAYLDGSGPSSITTTAQVLLAMRRHNQAWANSGMEQQPPLDATVINRGLDYLSWEVARLPGEAAPASVLDTQAYAFYVLALHGRLDSQWARSFMAYAAHGARKQEKGLSRDGQAWLALALWHGGHTGDALALIDRLIADQSDARQIASVPLLDSLLLASVGQKQPESGNHNPASVYEITAAKVARALMEARQGSGWSDPALTADAIWALSEYAVQSGDKPGAYPPHLMLNDRALQAPTQSDDPATVSLVLTGDTLHAGTSWLKLKSSTTGQPVYYSLTLKATR